MWLRCMHRHASHPSQTSRGLQDVYGGAVHETAVTGVPVGRQVLGSSPQFRTVADLVAMAAAS